MARRQPRKLSLLQIGLLCIFGAICSHLFSPLITGPPKNQAEALGKSSAVVAMIVVGVGLCVAHFVRRRGSA